jgi:hypothetical protein
MLLHAYTFPQRQDSYPRLEPISDHSASDLSDGELASLSTLCASPNELISPLDLDLLTSLRTSDFLIPPPSCIRINSAPLPSLQGYHSDEAHSPPSGHDYRPRKKGNNTFGRSGKKRCRQCRIWRQKVTIECRTVN